MPRTLIDEVDERYNRQFLIGLCNPNDRAASTLDKTSDDAPIVLASTDVEADFEIVAGVIYDNDDKRHVAVGIEGVIAKLSVRMNQAGDRSKALVDGYMEKLERLALVTGRNRLLPLSKSELQPSDEVPEGYNKVRPKFDGARFCRRKPTGPPGAERDHSLITNT